MASSKNEKRKTRSSPIKVAALCGSLRAESFTRRALALALEGAKRDGAVTQMLDLRDYQLVFCDGSEEGEYPADVHRLRADIKASDGLILGSPEYHGCFSGVLKNALDLMRFDEMQGKMIGLLAVSGGPLGSLIGLSSLREVGRSLRSWVIPDQVVVPEAWKIFKDDGSVSSPKMEARLVDLGQQVARFAHLHKLGRAQDFQRIWEQAVQNPGAD
jgi:NAD(P)H-dependent FMN reductase